MQHRFEYLDHTADAGIVAWGADLKEAFASAAYAMFTVLADLDQVEESEELGVMATAGDVEGLLVEWLNELVYIFETEHLLLRRFDIIELSGSNLKALVYGEEFDITKHTLRTGIKAVTYHMLEVAKDGDDYKVQVILDI